MRGGHAFVTVTLAIAASALSLGCRGQTCTCHGDVCADCSGTTHTAPAPDAGDPEAGDATVESAVPHAAGDVADAAIDASTEAVDASTAAGSSDSGAGGSLEGGVGAPDAGSGQDAGVANGGGAQCIPGCSRGQILCAAPDPPIGWSCSGSGISAAVRFVEGGCSSLPINSIAWCCPNTFLSQCVCTPGQDWTCNDDPTISSLHGTCLRDHSCSCSIGSGMNPVTGKCR